MGVTVKVARPRGRPKKTWREIMEKDCQSVSQLLASSSSSPLVSCLSASPAVRGRFTASRCHLSPLWSLADFVIWLSRSAQQHQSLLPITDNHLLTMSCPLNNYWHVYCGIVSAKDLVSSTATLEVSFPILFRASEVNTCLYNINLTWYQCSWVASGFAFIFCSVLHQP